MTVYHNDTGDMFPETRAYVANVAATVPHFRKIQTDAPAWIATYGIPSDLAPFNGLVRLASNTPLSYAVRAGHAWAENCSGLDVYDSNGLPCLPITREMLVSA